MPLNKTKNENARKAKAWHVRANRFDDYMKILILLMMQFCLYACTSTEEDHMSEIPFIKNENIQFYGDQSVRNDAIKLLDRVLKEQGDFGSYGNLSGGIDDIKKDMNIKITEEEYYYSIAVSYTHLTLPTKA